jgi:RNA polymerase sigma-70 factor, ECF subfamily
VIVQPLQIEASPAWEARLRAGDPQAMRELYHLAQPKLYRFALAFSGSESRAAEAVQQAFLDLLRRPSQFDPQRGTPLALLFGMVRNRLRTARRLEREEPLEEDNPCNEEIHLNLEREQRVAAVREAIYGLPEHYREVILLCEMEECRYEDAAQALALPVGTVRSRLNRAKAQLRARLKAFQGGC